MLGFGVKRNIRVEKEILQFLLFKKLNKIATYDNSNKRIKFSGHT